VSGPELTGALSGLVPLAIGDLPRFKAAVEAARHEGWSWYLPHLLSRNREGRRSVLIGEDGGSLCVYFWRGGTAPARLDLYLPPVPLDIAALDRALARADEHNGDHSAEVLRVGENDAATLTHHARLRLVPRRVEYLYDPAAFADLGGGRYRTLRRHTALVEALSGVEVRPYEPGDAAACLSLLERWREGHRAAHGNAGGAGASRRVLALAGRLLPVDLLGEVVLVDGRLTAFAFGGEIRPGLACFLEAKSDGTPGMSHFHRRSFLLRLRGFELVNDGSDLGRPGLRQLKESLRPVRTHAEFRATRRPR